MRPWRGSHGPLLELFVVVSKLGEDAKESGATGLPSRLLGDAAPNITAAVVKPGPNNTF